MHTKRIYAMQCEIYHDQSTTSFLFFLHVLKAKKLEKKKV